LRDTAFAYLVGDAVLGDSAALNVPGNVRCTGWLSGADLNAYYETADVIVVPSRWEGFGLIAVEAMRAGLPVIATRVGGLAEIVEHGVTGLLVEPGSPAALREAIRAPDDLQLKAMGEAGRERFLRLFTLDRMHDQLTSLYQSLVPQPSSTQVRSTRARDGRVSTKRAAVDPSPLQSAGSPQPEGSPHA
jgi:glycosyltransferase involved in cell wall biosynthesis